MNSSNTKLDCNTKLCIFVANEALKNLEQHRKSKSILITGPSGAGKTESTKDIVDFLCRTTNLDFETMDPILEAFGNAKTHGNANSSRFCKYIQVKVYPQQSNNYRLLHFTNIDVIAVYS